MPDYTDFVAMGRPEAAEFLADHPARGVHALPAVSVGGRRHRRGGPNDVLVVEIPGRVRSGTVVARVRGVGDAQHGVAHQTSPLGADAVEFHQL